MGDWTKEQIQENVLKNDQWLVRGLLAIFDKQTSDEQYSEETKYHNGIGFNGVDAPFMSSLAVQYRNKGFLSEKQKVYARKKMKKYCGQLLKIANGKI